eukprot:TRINITY_DN81530_c0_g1_i1.p1 TRINITY_DN81530_c0_g1~~TRINITY_DN81530_c0_g1_i1.p1  ORF type:complete len:149 (+),score=6.40 TRINITY_DN81530_c0_g1_i1:72-518(+)
MTCRNESSVAQVFVCSECRDAIADLTSRTNLLNSAVLCSNCKAAVTIATRCTARNLVNSFSRMLPSHDAFTVGRSFDGYHLRLPLLCPAKSPKRATNSLPSVKCGVARVRAESTTLCPSVLQIAASCASVDRNGRIHAVGFQLAQNIV